jgi:hypothetical protein
MKNESAANVLLSISDEGLCGGRVIFEEASDERATMTGPGLTSWAFGKRIKVFDEMMME